MFKNLLIIFLASVWISLLVQLVPQPQVLGVTTVNTPPASGYRRQLVRTDSGNFYVRIIAADTSNTRIIIDTASGSNCGNDCPVLSLKDYVKRNGAIAGINGGYFCPASYPACSSKKNSFDLLLMNSKKTYFNSDNNIYSNNPAVIFGGGYVRFVRSASEWGRDTGIDGMISNYPLLVFNRQNVYGGSGDTKLTSRGSRGFVANNGNRVYIGIVERATVAQAAQVLTTLGVDNAMNLDSGGSTALWANNAYRAGPGRAIPNAILFVAR
ncbi:MAG: phosphodiester glycosidase family protein [Microgenomates group bacterium]